MCVNMKMLISRIIIRVRITILIRILKNDEPITRNQQFKSPSLVNNNPRSPEQPPPDVWRNEMQNKGSTEKQNCKDKKKMT